MSRAVGVDGLSRPRPRAMRCAALPLPLSLEGNKMSKYASRKFWVDAADRAVATVAQTAVATLTAGAAGILAVDWLQVGSVAGLAGVVSVLTSVAFRGRGEQAPEQIGE